jgi:DNA ligase 1
MAAAKRDFKNFRAFGGRLADGIYAFPRVESRDSAGRVREWSTFVRLVKLRAGDDGTRNVNWEDDFATAPIRDEYFDGAPIPEGIVAQLWNLAGIQGMQLTKSSPTYISVGKNLGRANQTNAWQQALIKARSFWMKKKDAAGDEQKRDAPRRYIPQAVKKFEETPRDAANQLRWPCAVQPKYNGGRMVASGGDMYSRKLKDIDGNNHIRAELALFFGATQAKWPGAYLDGELYKHGVSLQVISGLMRASKKPPPADAPLLDFIVFDVFFPARAQLTFAERLEILKDMFTTALMAHPLQYIKLVTTYMADGPADEDRLYKGFLAEGYEGSIVRNLDGVYEMGTEREKRSWQVRKHKPRHSAEYEVVGFTEGEVGKDKGALIWELKGPAPPGGAAATFTSTPNMPLKERKELFARLKASPAEFEAEWKGRPMTVEYDELSDDGIPLRAKAVGLRLVD